MKYKHCSKIYIIIYEITKYLLTYKVQQKLAHCIVSCNILYKTNDFLITKTKAMLFLSKPINKKKSLYIDAFDRKDPASINKKC